MTGPRKEIIGFYICDGLRKSVSCAGRQFALDVYDGDGGGKTWGEEILVRWSCNISSTSRLNHIEQPLSDLWNFYGPFSTYCFKMILKLDDEAEDISGISGTRSRNELWEFLASIST